MLINDSFPVVLSPVLLLLIFMIYALLILTLKRLDETTFQGGITAFEVEGIQVSCSFNKT